MKFRPHRGGLDESMAETKEFSTMTELKVHLSLKGWNSNELVFTYIGHDERVGWDAWYVSCIDPVTRHPFVVGMIDGQFTTQPNTQ